MTAAKIVLLVIVVIFGGGRLIPWVLEKIAETHSLELFTLAVLVIALGIAYGSSALFGVSMELGAFLAGMVVGRSEFSFRAASDALPMRDAFAVLFFVSVGMLFDPYKLAEDWPLILATLAIVVIGKPLAAVLVVLLFGRPLRSALSVAVALAQLVHVGEIARAAEEQQDAPARREVLVDLREEAGQRPVVLVGRGRLDVGTTVEQRRDRRNAAIGLLDDEV